MNMFIKEQECVVCVSTQDFILESEVLPSVEMAEYVLNCLENCLEGNESEEDVKDTMNHCIKEFKKTDGPKLKPRPKFRMR